ncbi:MAG: hypothetical protein WDA02_11075 [Saccharofermentanales bacterium]
MKIYKIKSKSQENGLWGNPINLRRLEFKGYSVFHIKTDQKLISATIIKFDEIHNKPFKCYLYSDKIMFQIIDGERYTEYYDNLRLIDEKLYVFKNDDNKKPFDRLLKIKKLNDSLQYR